ncbi:MAG: Fic family protein [Hyphomicrobiales bacterium]|nr:Fic family protein [Hyphomicrobiales bacterium]
MSGDRHSIAQHRHLITDPDEKARREAENGIRQFYLATDIIREHIHDRERPFALAPRPILQLHHAALEGIDTFAGTYRNTPVTIAKSRHRPPEHFLVPELVAQLCDYVAENWDAASAIHLAAYVQWRLNWIHPFADGNGRTSRAVMYVVLNIRLDGLLAGTPTIPDQIADDKRPYYDALEAADTAWAQGTVDLTVMEQLLEGMLARQLLNAVEQASEGGTRSSG